ncbi:MAG: 1-acyl-sn-glycerol-3-phosphate acyltransferase [Candidatus Rokubacteria bacterium]|nr:1-acyl-sn-glycerol-3-phosphate acyltransferase [Candidatus Rokubacteria bacterium]MBI4593878.1 1-acyl-sn-glycerol-3-phosphate acyltransferase [Candidatus Rokubacteria bacterium]
MARSTALTATPRVAGDGAAAPPLYRALRAAVRTLLARAFDLAIEGQEHLPEHGPYIVAANHHNYLDGVVLGAAVPAPISFLVMPRVWHASPFHPAFHRYVGSILLNLERPDVGALRRALGGLEHGRVIGIFPEGPFSVRGRLEPGLPGVGLLALHSGVPVIPTGIRGTYEALAGRRFYIPRRHPLRVRFGPPRRFSVADGASPRQTRWAVTERIMADIAALLS